MTAQFPTEMTRTDTVLRNLWRNWTLVYGAFTLPMLVAIFVPRIWVTAVCFLAGYALSVVMKRRQESGTHSCPILISLGSKVLYISAVAMLVVVILCTDWLVPTVIHIELYNTGLPFVTCLIEFPVLAIISAIYLRMGLRSPVCRKCQRRNGYYAGDSLVATLYYRESKYQMWILLLLSVALGAVEYWYYFARYINYNLNAPDIFFFNIFPLVIYLLSLPIMAGRYKSMHALFNSMNASSNNAAGTTQVRFLTFCGNDLLLHQSENGQWDTPFSETIARTPSIGETQARVTFQALADVQNFHLRYCYTNAGFAQGTNVIHFAAFVGRESRDGFRPDDQWFTAYMIDQAMAVNAISPMLANELYRIHTMTMAWKTYDRNGHRLYPIKHYRPTFRFEDLPKWDINYDDTEWLDIASYNEDSHFFRAHRLWKKMTNIFHKRKPIAQ